MAALGCTFTGNETDGYDFETCTANDWFIDVAINVFFSGKSWTNISEPVTYANELWHVYDEGFGDGHVTNPHNLKIGARPIITVTKDVIAN